MQRYQSHKIVEAVKIVEVKDQTVRFEGEATFKVMTQEWRVRFQWTRLNDLGYFVRYENGHEGWWPTEEFEAGYTPVDEVGAITTEEGRH